QAVAIPAKMPGLARHRTVEGCFHLGSNGGLEVDALMVAAVVDQRRYLLVVIERATLEAQLQLFPVWFEVAREGRMLGFEAVSGEGLTHLAAGEPNHVHQRLFVRSLLKERLEFVASAQIPRNGEPPDHGATQDLRQRRPQVASNGHD